MFGLFALYKRMRIPRSIQLFEEQGIVHKYWKCHNSEYLLNQNKEKELYLDSTFESLNHKSVLKNITISSFCIMDNHAHMQLGYTNGSNYLSNFMRISHSKFGYRFNKSMNRTGKVANERPKTPFIQSNESLMRVHFYIEANPIRAKKLTLEQLKHYKFSSYPLYAFGIKNKWTKKLTVPDWYLDLGNSLKQRQRKYRELFALYLKEMTDDLKYLKKTDFIGDSLWRFNMVKKIKIIITYQKALNSS